MRIVLIVLGSILLVFGALSMVTPIPGGFILLGLGTAMLIHRKLHSHSKRIASEITSGTGGSAEWHNGFVGNI